MLFSFQSPVPGVFRNQNLSYRKNAVRSDRLTEVAHFFIHILWCFNLSGLEADKEAIQLRPQEQIRRWKRQVLKARERQRGLLSAMEICAPQFSTCILLQRTENRAVLFQGIGRADSKRLKQQDRSAIFKHRRKRSVTSDIFRSLSDQGAERSVQAPGIRDDRLGCSSINHRDLVPAATQQVKS